MTFLKFPTFQEVDLQALVNAIAFSALLWGATKAAKRCYVHKAHPTAFSRYRCIRHRKPPRGSLHLLTVFIVCQQDEYFYLIPHNKREHYLLYAFGERVWFTACVPEIMYRNAIVRHQIHHFVVTTHHYTSICFRQMG